MPPDVFDGCDMTSKKPWCFSHALSTAFWKSWMTEFRTIIQEPKKWAERTKNLRIEDLVLLTDASDTRGPSRESWRSSRQRTELRVQQSSRSDLPKSIALPPRFTRWTWNIVFDSQAGSVMILTERDSYSIILSILILFLCSSFSFFSRLFCPPLPVIEILRQLVFEPLLLFPAAFITGFCSQWESLLIRSETT